MKAYQMTTIRPIIVCLCFLYLPSFAATYPPDTILQYQPLATVAMPGYLSPITDPLYKTRITRISDKAAMNMSSPRSDRIGHRYAKNQAYNCDESLIMFDWNYPAPILDAKTYEVLRTIHQPSQATWSNVDPYTTFGVTNNNRFVKADMRTDWAMTTLHVFSEYDVISLGEGEGNISNNDQFAAFQCKKGTQTSCVIYDIKEDSVIATLDLGGGWPNNVSMSQSGKFAIIGWQEGGTGIQLGMDIYTLSSKTMRKFPGRGGSHFDMGYDTQGNEVIVLGDPFGTRAIVMQNLLDSAIKTVLPASVMNYQFHISCRNTKRPGWAYLSEYTGSNNTTPNVQKVFAVKLDGSAKVEIFAQEHHSSSTAYERTAMAMPNHDGSKVLFASDWGNATGPIYCYAAEMPEPVSMQGTRLALHDSKGTSIGPVLIKDATFVEYFLHSSLHTNISLYNSHGALIRNLLCGYQEKGRHSIVLNGKDDANVSLSKGIYYLQLKAGTAKPVSEKLLYLNQ